ncbi:MAG: hypothetical protein AB7O43_23400, partial [Hyphomicrobiaceae bacterium]
MPAFPHKAVAGFLTGALSVLVFHQGMYFALIKLGFRLSGTPWEMSPGGPYGVPVLLNQMFWGGLWGLLFAYLVDHLPSELPWLKGLVFGMVFPMLLGGWLVVSLLKGRPLFGGAFTNGFNPAALLRGFLLNGVAFGIGLGLLYRPVATELGLWRT